VQGQQKGEATRVGEEGEAVGPGAYVPGLTDGGDGVADPVAVDGPAVGALGGDEVHELIFAGAVM
jgi:hypothetical protein